MRQISIPISLNHIYQMTSKIGFYQFAKGSTPDLKFGYSIDDQARALILAIEIYRQSGDKKFLKLAEIYLNFIKQAQLPSGFFHNFADKDGKFIDRIGSMDSFSRTIWALGFTISKNIPKLSSRAQIIWEKSSKNIKIFKHIRPIAFSLLGLCYYIKVRPEKKFKKLLENLSESLIKKYKENSQKNWNWFEKKLVYSNAIIPYSLLCAYEILKKEQYKKIAQESLDFLNKTCKVKDKPAPIGFEGWFPRNGQKAIFGQQPIDAADMVLANVKAFQITKDKKYKIKAQFWFSWFFGNNLLNKPLYNKKSGGCFDGLFKDKVNPNQGAESTILFHLANQEIKNLEK